MTEPAAAPPVSGSVAFAVGRCFVGLAAAGSGALQLVTGDPVRLFPTAAGSSGSTAVWPYAVGVLLVAAGCAIAAGRRVRLAAGVVAGLILVSLIVESVPRLLASPWVGYMWTNPLKSVALAAGAALLVAAPTAAAIRGRVGRVERVAVLALALFLFVCGLQHFVYADFVTELVPAWIPGRRGWTYLTGAALIAGGAGMLVPRVAALAAGLSSLMIFLWVPLLHIPRAVTGPYHAHETAGVFEALAISGIALMIAVSCAAPPAADRSPSARLPSAAVRSW
jgi:uncharacterized membrane protein YphA (DoxX/SURF4 family)